MLNNRVMSFYRIDKYHSNDKINKKECTLLQCIKFYNFKLYNFIHFT